MLRFTILLTYYFYLFFVHRFKWGLDLLLNQLSPGGGRLIIASDGVWDALSSEKAVKICRGERHPEVAAKNVVKVCASPGNSMFFTSFVFFTLHNMTILLFQAIPM